MKYFAILLLKLFAGALLLLVLLDVFYTYSYSHPFYARSKPSWLYQHKDSHEIYDYVLFGSSRCDNNVNPVVVEEVTGLRGYNLAYPACNPFEIKLLMKTFLESSNKTKSIFVQVDDEFNTVTPDRLAVTAWMPFIYDDYIYEQFSQYSQDSLLFCKRSIPFYRYMAYDTRIGHRDVLLGYLKPNGFEETLGYSGVFESIKKHPEVKLLTLKNKMNPHIEDMIAMAKSYDVELYFFTAPYLNVHLNTEVLASQLKNYHDFSKVYSEPSYFADQNHLNAQGAEEFSRLFASTYFEDIIMDINR